MIITIDGPAGSGKSTIARALARRLGWMFLDTGAMYRVVALLVKREGLEIGETGRIAELAHTADIGFEPAQGDMKVWVGREEVTPEIRTEAVSQFASQISTIPSVRQALVQKQRDLGIKYGNIVTEGRDQGSVVFPHAELKVYLDADVAERARRRYEQLLDQGQSADMEKILVSLKERDLRDKTREASPLVVPDNAVVVDTTRLTPEQVMERIIELVKERS
jgi:cytidylate kinase